MNRDVDLQVYLNNGSCLVVAPGFGVVAKGTDAPASIKEAMQKIEAVKQLYREAGVQLPSRSVDQSQSNVKPASSWSNANTSAIPTAIICGLIIAGLVLLASVPIVSAVARLGTLIQSVALTEGAVRVETLGRSAASAVVSLGAAVEKLTPERKEELRTAVRQIAGGLGPILDEITAARQPSAPSPPQAP